MKEGLQLLFKSSELSQWWTDKEHKTAKHILVKLLKFYAFQWPHGIKSLLHMLLGMNNKHVSLVSPAKANSLPLAPPGKPKWEDIISTLLCGHHFADKGPSSQSCGFSKSHVRMWELNHKEGWAPKNWCFRIVM